jgi:hypothetical protein
MTNISIHATEQSSRFNGTLTSLFMAATVAIAGFLSLAMFAG